MRGRRRTGKDQADLSLNGGQQQLRINRCDHIWPENAVKNGIHADGALGSMDKLEDKFAHLLQPIRDLAANWDINIANELEDYLVGRYMLMHSTMYFITTWHMSLVAGTRWLVGTQIEQAWHVGCLGKRHLFFRRWPQPELCRRYLICLMHKTIALLAV